MTSRRGFLGALAALVAGPKALAAMAKTGEPADGGCAKIRGDEPVTSGFAQTVMAPRHNWPIVTTTTNAADGTVQIWGNTIALNNNANGILWERL
jgi:hypothetical protein